MSEDSTKRGKILIYGSNCEHWSYPVIIQKFAIKNILGDLVKQKLTQGR